MNDSMTVSEVCEYAERSRQAVNLWLKKGWIPFKQNPLTRRITVSKADVDQLLTEGPPHRRQEAQATQ